MVNTTFKITRTGTPILSAKMIGDTVIRMLNEYCPDSLTKPCVVDLDAFFRDYLHMTLEEQYLSHDGHIFGMTVFGDTDKLPVWVPERQEADYYTVKAGTVLVDGRCQSEEMLRFTKAHEAGHSYFHNVYFQRNPGKKFCRENAETLNQKKPDDNLGWKDEDWLEWHANTFASCLLMPEPAVRKLISTMPRIRTGDLFGDREERIYKVSEEFQVSRTAAFIRLEGLDLLKEADKTGYVSLNLVTDDYTGVSYASIYVDGLGNHIPERPVDPPDPSEPVMKRKRRKNKK